ncbi:nuclear protein localization protein 4 KNAG_0A03410 [Huiozyma naganishii CBS 8797]|uniref:Nuclear protein localization protein 4 n=1 Tax=Huiozyma naganishii (strain ATCC MYA-139 / BCRC 22969 / CBS 8797 / KCTC 17520 / NBRC 10181 / NCYC 3082 / Yp74L-3) TaxID=1071383 RepID=J7S288_HUIN7|nr:hypothetical protein KNAG_0A03410 [Kazachstania naganishii CBS 8797]CCK68024.1 hypothetical protein KNAG_0A03410 [Kazachstania naganishii CBS 8797]
MLVRFRSKDGMQRVRCEEGEPFQLVVERWMANVSGPVDLKTVCVGREASGRGEPLETLVGKSVRDMGLQQGDIVYVNYETAGAGGSAAESMQGLNLGGSAPGQQPATGSVKIMGGSGGGGKVPQRVVELPVDESLEREDGLIIRSRSGLCKHGERGMCEYCSPLPPWDRGYHEEHSIKHISFHSYLKKLNENTNKGTGGSYVAPLSQPDFKIDKNCKNGHEPWPRGICSKCQPSAITLQTQEFRMVDHVEFQNSELVNQFIESWRSTGMQRFAYMYGTYSRYDSTPLGIKAVVEAIYEPPQHDEQDGLTMDMDQVTKEMDAVDALAFQMGLFRVGFIFTDLTDAGQGDGSVFCKRHKDSYFLTSFETIMAARHQMAHANACKFSERGTFSSKFVTCVVSGNLEGEIDIASYQVSIDAEALVDAQMISGSTHPSMAYINETTDERYVPELFYMKKNEYGLTVKENAKPAFPVDYLIVSLTHGFPKDSAAAAAAGATAGKFATTMGFPWANRQIMGHSQDYQELKKYLEAATTAGDYNLLRKKLSNFHVLLYIHSLQILSHEEWSLLIQAAASGASPEHDQGTEQQQQHLFELLSSPGWQTLAMILEESSF